MPIFRAYRIPLLILFIIVISACGDGKRNEKSEEVTRVAVGTTSSGLPPALDMPTLTAGAIFPDGSVERPTPFTFGTLEPSDDPTPIGAESVQVTPAAINPSSLLNAGDIDDNGDWSGYQAYRNSFLLRNSELVHDVDVSERHTITVAGTNGLPILGARVMVFGGQDLIGVAQTDSSGTARFYTTAWAATAEHQSLRVVVQKDQTAAQFSLDPGQSTEWMVEIDTSVSNERIALDVVFLLDATGSMSDEIAQLQDNILAISSEIADLPTDTDVRYGLVTYRDRGDEYVTRRHDFVSDVEDFQETLNEVEAFDGGDAPESLNEALHVAVQDMDWRGDDAIKLIFLVADAEPHLDYEDDYDYVYEMIAAAWDGIKIHPIASSGLSPTGEFIFRQLAQYTQGHFLFLTYEKGVAGTAGTERTDLEAGSGEFTVEYLDDMVLKLITDEIEALNVPIGGFGVEPRLSSAEVVGTQDMPRELRLQTSASGGQRTVTVKELRGAPEEPLTVNQKLDRALVILLGFMAVLASVPVMVVVLDLRIRRRTEKRKRKNEELWSGFEGVEPKGTIDV